MDGVERSVGHEAVACGQRPPEEREHVNEDGMLEVWSKSGLLLFPALGSSRKHFSLSPLR